MSMLSSKYFPDVFLRVQFRAVTWQIAQLQFVARFLSEVGNRFALVVRRTIKNEQQITIGRSPESHQESTKSLLREIVQLHPVAKTAQTRACAEGFDAFVTPEGATLRCLPNARPGALPRALRRQRHFIFKEERGGFQACAPRNLWLALGFPAVLRRRVGQRPHALWFLDTEATRAQQFGNVVRVRADAKLRADDSCDAPGSPQIVRKARSQCPGINQSSEQQQFLFCQLCRTPRTWFRQQACITVALEVTHPVGNGPTGDAKTGRHFTISILARNHNQTATTAWPQLQFFTPASHGYPPFPTKDTCRREFA